MNTIQCTKCGRPSDCLQAYWYGFPRKAIQEIKAWFDENRDADSGYVGLVVCSVCDLTSFTNMFRTNEDFQNLQQDMKQVVHDHKDNASAFQCVVSSEWEI